jgi:hypothetical protein
MMRHLPRAHVLELPAARVDGPFVGEHEVKCSIHFTQTAHVEFGEVASGLDSTEYLFASLETAQAEPVAPGSKAGGSGLSPLVG